MKIFELPGIALNIRSGKRAFGADYKENIFRTEIKAEGKKDLNYCSDDTLQPVFQCALGHFF